MVLFVVVGVGIEMSLFILSIMGIIRNWLNFRVILMFMFVFSKMFLVSVGIFLGINESLDIIVLGFNFILECLVVCVSELLLRY